MRIRVYQVNKENFPEFGFMDYQFFKANGCEDMRRDMYHQTFAGDVDTNDLEGVFTMFNLNPPAGFAGHSMSVSDLVETNDGLFFCDSFGFTKVKWRVDVEELKSLDGFTFQRGSSEFKLVYSGGLLHCVSLLEKKPNRGWEYCAFFDNCADASEVFKKMYVFFGGVVW